MNVLIIGGSGVLSADFTKIALDNNCKVTILNRGRRKCFIDPRANLICADIRMESIEELQAKINVQCYDVVVDFLSFVPSHVEKILKAIEGNFTQYIFISSATVYKKKHEDEIITEKTPLGNDRWNYAYNKYLCEVFLRQQKIKYTIIRPYVTYGVSRIPFPIIANRSHYTMLERIRVGKPIPLFEDGKAICTLTHTTDFSKILYKLLLNEKAYQEAFHITSDSVQSWKDVYYTICKIMNCPSREFSIDEQSVRKYLPEFLDVLLGDKGTNMIFDNSKVISVVGGYHFSITLEEGLKQSVEFYLQTPAMQQLDYKWDGRIDYLYRKSSTKPNRILTSLSGNTGCNSKLWYYAMIFSPTKTAFDLLWKVKHKYKDKWR